MPPIKSHLLLIYCNWYWKPANIWGIKWSTTRTEILENVLITFCDKYGIFSGENKISNRGNSWGASLNEFSMGFATVIGSLGSEG